MPTLDALGPAAGDAYPIRAEQGLQAPRVETKASRSAVTGSTACDVGGDEAPTCPRAPRGRDEGALRSSRASSIATTSKRETMSAMQRKSKRSRLGESSWPERHFSVTRPKARRLQVATRRLRSRCLGGIVPFSAAMSRPKTSARSCGSGSVISGVIPSLN